MAVSSSRPPLVEFYDVSFPQTQTSKAAKWPEAADDEVWFYPPTATIQTRRVDDIA